MEKFDSRVVKTMSDIQNLRIDIDSYCSLAKKLNGLVPPCGFRIHADSRDAVRFNDKKILDVLINSNPEFFCKELNPSASKDLYEMRLGGAGKHDQIYAVFNLSNIPKRVSEKFHLEIHEPTASIRNARTLLLHLISETINRMPRATHTYLSNQSYVSSNDSGKIIIIEEDWPLFCDAFDSTSQLFRVSMSFYYRVAHGLKAPISLLTMEYIKSFMGTATSEELIFKQIHIALNLDGFKKNGYFMDLSKIKKIQSHQPPGICKLRTFPVVSHNIGTFTGLTYLDGVDSSITHINAYSLNSHQKRPHLLPYCFLTAAQLGFKIYNGSKRKFLDNLDQVISNYCESIKDGMPLRIEFVLTLEKISDSCDIKYLEDLCTLLLYTLIKKELIIKLPTCQFYADRIISLFEEVKKKYRCQLPLTKVQLSELHQIETAFWSNLEKTTWRLFPRKESDYEATDIEGKKYLRKWHQNFIVEELLPSEPDEWHRYKGFLEGIYESILCKHNWCEELFADGYCRRMDRHEQFVYFLLYAIINYAKTIGLMPITPNFIFRKNHICPLRYMNIDYIMNNRNKEAQYSWSPVLESPVTVRDAIFSPNTFEGKVIRDIILPEELQKSKEFHSVVQNFLVKYHINVFPTYLLYGIKNDKMSWSEIFSGKPTDVPNGVELSGMLRRQLNLKQYG